MKSSFTVPKLIIPKNPSSPWLIYFRYEGNPIRKKYGLNYIQDLKKREKEGEMICEVHHEKLKNKWNPLLSENEFDESHEIALMQAIDFAIEKKAPNLSPKLLSGYKGTVNFCKTAIKALKLENLLLEETKRAHIKAILEKAKDQRKWTNNAYNKNLGYLQAVLSELIQWDMFYQAPGIYSMKHLGANKDISIHYASFMGIRQSS